MYKVNPAGRYRLTLYKTLSKYSHFKTNNKYLSYKGMIILLQSASSQTFKFIPRVLTADSMVITDEGTNTSVTIAITPIIDRYYLSVSEVLTLVDGRSYTVIVLNGLEEVYRYTGFCTNQVVSDYSISAGTYIENATDNEYVIIP